MARPNELIHESSPYLRQHAWNPVHWVPWSTHAFERARREDKPVFLSIGYSTCHWCHVMERESFEDPEVADLMNRAFVNIKVDREERPDIDAFYMAACQVFTGSGGWPLTILTDADRRPFFAGTYIPRTNRWNRVGLIELIPRIEALWQTDRDELADVIDRLGAALHEIHEEVGEACSWQDMPEQAMTSFRLQFDAINGGFGSAPKFPGFHLMLFLLDYHALHPHTDALDMALRTLRAIRMGGVFDQIGYGFHRYSTDGGWRVPHFEKMLYDQALALMAYSLAYAHTRDPLCLRTCHEILEYANERLRHESGGFFAAEDADSEGIEGKYYVWTRSEIEAALGIPEDVQWANERFGVTEAGNFPEIPGVNVLYTVETGSPVSEASRDGADKERSDRIIGLLRTARGVRVSPSRDEKVLTDWNGLMLAGLAIAGRCLADGRFIREAVRLESFFKSHLMPGGRHSHRWCAGETSSAVMASDLAYHAWGLMELYESTRDRQWLGKAEDCVRELIERFGDPASGGLFFSPADASDVPYRVRDSHDGAIPSAESVSVWVMHRLDRHFGTSRYEDRIRRIVRANSALVRHPSSQAFVVRTIMHMQDQREVDPIHGNRNGTANDGSDPIRVSCGETG